MAIKNLILDRDGTVIVDKHYLSDPSQVELLPHVGDTLRLLGQDDWRFFIVSNQSGIGRGFFTDTQVRACMAQMSKLLSDYGVHVEDVAYCPHLPEEHCACRKPEQGLWMALQTKYQLDPAKSVMVGDKSEDMAFGARAGFAQRVLVSTGKGASHAAKLGIPTLPEGGYTLCQPISEVWPSVYAHDFHGLYKALSFLQVDKA